ncbi:hypothetical protein MASR1M107_16950 [Ignavibacteriales bacterium]
MDELDFPKFVPLFENLDDETIHKISDLGKRKMFPKDTVVLMEHETGNALFVIMSGKVKVSRESDDGREVILTYLNPNDFFAKWHFSTV